MRLAQVCPRYPPHIGGIETHVSNVSEALVRRGCQIDVLTTDPTSRLGSEETRNGVNIIRFKSCAPGEAFYFSRPMKTYLSRNAGRYDIVHAHNYHSLPALYASQTKTSSKFVFTPHYHARGHTFMRNLLLLPYGLLGKTIFERADQIICVSNYEKELVTSRFRFCEGRIIVVPHGISPDEFRQLRDHQIDKQLVLCVSRLEKYKGIQYLLQAVRVLPENITVEIVGKGPYKTGLVRLAQDLGVEHRVRFYEDLERMRLLKKYSEAQVLVLLSRYEAFGMAVMEALAAGTPCIVANTSALREWVDNRNCFGIDYPIDVGELAALMRKVIGTRAEQIQFLTWDDVAQTLMGVYENLLSKV